METVIILEVVFKRGGISGCYTASTRNMKGILPTTLGFMLSGSVFQALFVFRVIPTIGSCQSRKLPIMELLEALLEEKAMNAST